MTSLVRPGNLLTRLLSRDVNFKGSFSSSDSGNRHEAFPAIVSCCNTPLLTYKFSPKSKVGGTSAADERKNQSWNQ